MQNILTGLEFTVEGRKFVNRFDYNTILVMTHPSMSSCVHFMDGLMPDLSEYDRSEILLVSSKSNLENVIMDDEFKVPPEEIFGQEPEKDWCYFYQKASFARQLRNWEQIVELESQATEKGVRPGDPVEWLPFLEANAMLGDENRVRDLSSIIQESRFTWNTACGYYQQDLRGLHLDNPDGYKMLIEKLCD